VYNASRIARVVHIDELDRIRVAGVNWRPVRRTLGITGFGVNAYTADADEQLIEEHDETGGGSGRHEELYIVIAGQALFTIDGEEFDASPGTLIHIPETAARRSALAVIDGTTAIVVGGRRGTIVPSAWEHYFAAVPDAEAGDPLAAYATAAAGHADHPDHPSLHYNLACYASLARDTERAIAHLRRAFDGDPRTREWAATDEDLDPIRSDPRYPK
jgi:hypothetical protein